MQKLGEKLLIGDYYQYFNYPVRKQIVQLYKEDEKRLLGHVLDGLVGKEEKIKLAKDVQAITIFDDRYPVLLLESYDPPLILYCKGNIELLAEERKVAIVGSRQPRPYSLDAVKTIMKDLISDPETKPVVVSGLAKGIDGASHKAALESDIPTIAVLGFGFDYMYPQENEQLAAAISKKGLLVSEYPPHIGVNRWQFVARNRIISGLCKVVIIVEAKEHSGSLITAELALAENREVFIVSGKGFDQAYLGSHLLVQEGAKLLLHVDEVMSEYKIK